MLISRLVRILAAGAMAILPLTGSAAPDPRAVPAVTLTPSGASIVKAVRLGDGKWIVAGNFLTINGLAISRLARLQADGTVDNTWNPGVDNQVHDILVEGSDLYIAGAFSNVGSVARKGLARIPLSGAVPDAWDPNQSEAGFVLVTGIATVGGDLIVAGSFASIGGIGTVRNLAKISKSTGAVDASWRPNPDGQVYRVFFLGGQLFAVGGFMTIESASGRLASAALAGVGLATGLASPGWALSIVPAGSTVEALATDGTYLYVGGFFSGLGSASVRNLARVDMATRTVDTTWSPNPDSLVTSLVMDASNRIVVGGLFSNIGPVAAVRRLGLARLSMIGPSVVDPWDPATNGGVLRVDIDGTDILVTGRFTHVEGRLRHGMALIPPLLPPRLALTTTPNPSTYGEPIAIRGRAGNGAAATGTMDFVTAAGLILCDDVPLDASSTAECIPPIAIDAGTTNIDLEYSGDAVFEAGTTRVSQSVRQAQSTMTIAATSRQSPIPGPGTVIVTLGPGVVAPGQGDPTGVVTIQAAENAAVMCQTTMPTDYSCTLTFPADGTYTLTASYPGDANFVGSTSSARTFVVGTPAAVGVTLTSSANPSLQGQPVTLTATVTGNAPTGTVTFVDMTTTSTLCTAAPLNAGTATCVVSAGLRSIGTNHTLQARYSGDANNGATVSNLPHAVNPGVTTLAYVVSSSAPRANEAVNVTVSMAAQAPAGAPIEGFARVTTTGPAAASCSMLLTDTGTCPIRFPVAGTYTLNVEFVTSSQWIGSTGAAQVITVAAPLPRTFSGPTATGTGTGSATVTGGGVSCGFARAQFIPATGHPRSATSVPQGRNFLHGLFDFRLESCTPGSTVTVDVTYPSLPAGAAHYKFGRTAADPTPHWYAIAPGVAATTATMLITDGGFGDDDLAVNGVIEDPAGPAVPAAAAVGGEPIPTLSEWMLAFLALSLVTIASAGLGRRERLMRPGR